MERHTHTHTHGRTHAHARTRTHALFFDLLSYYFSISLSVGHHENGVLKAENGASPRTKKIKAP